MGKRSIAIRGRKTSISLEDEFWQAFKEVAQQRNMSVGELADVVSRQNPSARLSSAIRVFVFDYFCELWSRKTDA